jgi:hypothetical protein
MVRLCGSVGKDHHVGYMVCSGCKITHRTDLEDSAVQDSSIPAVQEPKKRTWNGGRQVLSGLSKRILGRRCTKIVYIVPVAVDDGEEGLERINCSLHGSTLVVRGHKAGLQHTRLDT